MTGSPDFSQRLKLTQRLSALPGPQLDQVIFALKPAKGNIPPASAPPADRVMALLIWAESEIGCGLERVKEVLDAALAPLNNNALSANCRSWEIPNYRSQKPEKITSPPKKRPTQGEPNSIEQSGSNSTFVSDKVPAILQDLESHLNVQQWREADEKTYLLILEAAECSQEGWLKINSINKIPCSLMRDIDNLWEKYSQARFGLTVQKNIWKKIGKGQIIKIRGKNNSFGKKN